MDKGRRWYNTLEAMTTHEEVLMQAKAIINSCETYGQVKTCFSFLDNRYVCRSMLDEIKVAGMLQDKAYSMRNADLVEHIDQLKKIIKR